MTVNIWRARIESVCFGANSPRQMTAMFQTQKEAKALAADLLAYVGGQSILSAPQSQADAQKMSVLFQANHALKSGNTQFNASLQDAEGVVENLDAALNNASARADSQPATVQPALNAKFCSECGSRQVLSAKFCSDCGHGF
jgi:ribosomal protein L40E